LLLYFKNNGNIVHAEQFDMKWTLHFMDYIPNMAIFVSKSDYCLYEILLRYKAGELLAKITLVISNHPDLQYFFIWARKQ